MLEKSVGAEKTLLAVKPAYDAARAQGRAVGIACGMKNSGLGNGAIEFGKCRLVVEPDGDRRAPHRLHRDGPGAAHHPHPMRGRGHRPAGDRRSGPRSTAASRSAAARPPARAPRCSPGAPTIDAAQKLKADLDAGRTLADLVGKVYAGEVADRRHHRRGRVEERQDQDPHHLRLRDAGGRCSTRRARSRR